MSKRTALVVLGALALLVTLARGGTCRAGDEAGPPAARPGYLGFHLEPNPLLEPDRRVALGVEGAEGSVVAALVPGGPADQAGLRLGDRLLAFDGRPVPDPQTLTPKDRRSHHAWRVAIREMLESPRAGDVVALDVDRRGERLTLHVTAIDEGALRRLQLFGAAPRPLTSPTGAGAPGDLALALGDPGAALPDGLVPWEGRWEVVAAPGDVPSAVALRQDATTLPWAVLLVTGAGRAYADARASVRWMPVSGITDASGGIVFRAQDGRNYYVVRGNALEANLRIYIVKDGVRTELASVDDIELPALGAWSTLELSFVGDTFTAVMNGTVQVTAKDDTFASGWTGLWTKADSVTCFADLRVEPLPGN